MTAYTASLILANPHACSKYKLDQARAALVAKSTVNKIDTIVQQLAEDV